MSDRFMNNPAYVKYEALLRRLHDVAAQYGNDSTEADDVREQMEEPERRLNRSEINRLNGLSADLYMLQGEEVLQTPTLDLESMIRQMKAYQSGNDWDAVLELLRRRAPNAPPEATALSRARAYESLGHYDTALLFLDFAYRNKLGDPYYLALRIRLLADAGRLSEAVSDAEKMLTTKAGPPVLLIAAADVVAESAQSDVPEQARTKYQQSLSSLDALLRDTPPNSQLPTADFIVGQLVRAACLFGLRDAERALAALKMAVEADPNDSAMRSIYERARAEGIDSTRPLSLTDALNHARDLVRRWDRDLVAA